MDEEDVQFLLKQYNAIFVTYELSPGIYAIEDISDVFYPMFDHDGTLQIVYDDKNMNTKLLLTRFGVIFGTLRFDEKSFINILLGFTPCWDYKPTKANHADSPGVYSSEKTLSLSTISKLHLKCDCFDGSVVNGLRQPILFSLL